MLDVKKQTPSQIQKWKKFVRLFNNKRKTLNSLIVFI